MSFNIFYDKQPEKFLKKLDKHISLRIENKIEDALTGNPVPHNAVTIAGERGVYRIRIGDYRALYLIDYKNKKIVIVKVDKRPRVYN